MSFNPEKTEILFFSNTGNIDNIEFSFNGKSIPLSTSHKHLGVILSQNAKWNEHLENMITNITKHLGILRKLKFSLNRSNLEKMYLVYIRPLFEYACEVWDNCAIGSPFHCHACIFLVSHHFFPWSVIGVFFFILVTLDLCLLLIHRDLWNPQKWQILISVNRDFDFFLFSEMGNRYTPTFFKSFCLCKRCSKYM